jgi:hypothetical protein
VSLVHSAGRVMVSRMSSSDSCDMDAVRSLLEALVEKSIQTDGGFQSLFP